MNPTTESDRNLGEEAETTYPPGYRGATRVPDWVRDLIEGKPEAGEAWRNLIGLAAHEPEEELMEALREFRQESAKQPAATYRMQKTSGRSGMNNVEEPPELLDGARVLFWCWLPENAEGKQAAAICRYDGQTSLYLFYCDAEWQVVSDWQESLQDLTDIVYQHFSVPLTAWHRRDETMELI